MRAGGLVECDDCGSIIWDPDEGRQVKVEPVLPEEDAARFEVDLCGGCYGTMMRRVGLSPGGPGKGRERR